MSDRFVFKDGTILFGNRESEIIGGKKGDDFYCYDCIQFGDVEPQFDKFLKVEDYLKRTSDEELRRKLCGNFPWEESEATK